MNTFISAVEAWLPSSDGSVLEFGGGVFGAATQLRAASRGMLFGRAEGLPGRVWDTAEPELLTRLEGAFYRRSAAAAAGALGSAVALPLFKGDALSSVVVLYGAASPQAGAAIELWGHDARVTGDLSLVEGGYWGKGSGALGAVSRDTCLPRGSGLPGLAWQRGAAVFIDDLTASPYFLRGDVAASAGLRHALALPCSPRGSREHVVAFLAAPGLPIARRIESWGPAATSGALERRWIDVTEAAAEKPLPETALAAIVMAYELGVPGFVEASADDEASGLAAIPIAPEGVVTEVLVLHL